MLYRWQHVQVSRDFVPKVHFAYLKLRSYSELEIYHAQCIIRLLSAFIQFQVVLIFVMPLCWIAVITDYHFLSQSKKKKSLYTKIWLIFSTLMLRLKKNLTLVSIPRIFLHFITRVAFLGIAKIAFCT